MAYASQQNQSLTYNFTIKITITIEFYSFTIFSCFSSSLILIFVTELNISIYSPLRCDATPSKLCRPWIVYSYIVITIIVLVILWVCIYICLANWSCMSTTQRMNNKKQKSSQVLIQLEYYLFIRLFSSAFINSVIAFIGFF